MDVICGMIGKALAQAGDFCVCRTYTQLQSKRCGIVEMSLRAHRNGECYVRTVPRLIKPRMSHGCGQNTLSVSPIRRQAGAGFGQHGGCKAQRCWIPADAIPTAFGMPLRPK